MARPKGDPSRLIATLKAALKQARKGDIADAGLMARVAGMTWRNLLKTHIEPDPDFPILARGAEGVAWQFDVRAVLRHMIKRAEQRISENEKRARDQARLTGFTVPEEDKGASIADLRALLDMTLKVQAMKNEQRDKVDAGQAGRFLNGLFFTITETLMGSGSVIDPTGAMDPIQRAAFDDHMRDLCLTVKKRIAAFTGEYCARSIQAGTD